MLSLNGLEVILHIISKIRVLKEGPYRVKSKSNLALNLKAHTEYVCTRLAFTL